MKAVVRAYYGSAGDDETAAACAAFGIEAPTIEPVAIDVYPENWSAVKVFLAMSNQWHCSMGGREGLRFETLPVIEQRLGIPPEDSADVFSALLVMEREALRCFRALSKKS